MGVLEAATFTFFRNLCERAVDGLEKVDICVAFDGRRTGEIL